jgi:hypothetical protein
MRIDGALLAFLLGESFASGFVTWHRPFGMVQSRQVYTVPPLIAHSVGDAKNGLSSKQALVLVPSVSWSNAIAELEELGPAVATEPVMAVPSVAPSAAVRRPSTDLLLPKMSPPLVHSAQLQRPSMQAISDSAAVVTKKRRNGFRSLQQNSTRSLTSLEGGDLVCRVIARSDGKLPPATTIPCSPSVWRQLDDIFHAQAHDRTRALRYMKRPTTTALDGANNDSDPSQSSTIDDEKATVAVLRASLDNAGFKLLSKRDLDLCEALNAGYLLRLSILPDVSNLDPSIVQEFYPEHFDSNGNVVDDRALSDALLFDGRVLVFWRGYSQEVTRGRLLLPKLDFLQASLVQRLSGSVRNQLDLFGRYSLIYSLAIYRKATACFLSYMRNLADCFSNARISKGLRRMIRSPYFHSAYKLLNNGTLPSISQMRAAAETRGEMFKLSRYGGSKTKFVGSPNPLDALNPFIICEESTERSCGCNDAAIRAQTVNRDMYDSLNNDGLRCPYDSTTADEIPAMQLLERVSISNLVDVFSREGRRNLFTTLFSKSELVEPTYEEVVVIWRPLPQKELGTASYFAPPKIAYELADMFDIEGLPDIPKPTRPIVSPLQIRCFEDLPMANLLAVLPKTKLIFRPADAFVFDLVSILSFVAILGSLRFDSPRLDFLALVSVSLWIVRTVLRYSNKLARYDLLVKNFLTTKIAHRNAGALKYLATEAGTQKATRASLVHTWITSKIPLRDEPTVRENLVARLRREVNGLLDDIKQIPVDVNAALNDLEDLKLVNRIDAEGRLVEVVRDETCVSRVLKDAWGLLFDKTSQRRL